MLNHIVMMKFKPDVTDGEIETLEKFLDELPNQINEIHTYEFGRDIIGGERSYSFGLVSLFANEIALQRYQTHPAHLEVLKMLQGMCEDIKAVDFFGTDAGSLKKVEKEDPLTDLIKP